MRNRSDIDQLTERKIKEYVNTGGTRCPFCGSGDLVGCSVHIDAGSAYQDISCSGCGKEWTDSYKLTGVI